MTIETRDLLVEIGTEELPPRALHDLAYQFLHHLREQLAGQDIYPADGDYDSYYSPRRLAAIIKSVLTVQPDRTIERFGPAVDIAFDGGGKPTRAAEGFARSCGAAVEELARKDGKLFFAATEPGKPAGELIPGAINTALQKLPVPKRMRWGTGDTEFVRPVHWVVVLFGNEIIECDILGIRANRLTYGHRYHHPRPVELNQPADYADALRRAHVWLNDRDGSLKQEISSQANRLAAEVNGRAIDAEPDSDLVAENAALVEWPVALTGTFDPDYLSLPEEVLIATLEDQQRYFAVRDRDSAKLLPHFIAVANIESRQPDRVREGNERVIVPRLADAMFFWESDRAVRLETRTRELDGIIFQSKLGSLGDRMRRVRSLAAQIAETAGADTALVTRAAELAKCDLVSHLVGEFPRLQGTIGRYLAAHDGEAPEVAAAIEEHYRPRFAGDELPATPAGRALAVADRLDTIVGTCAIGQAPSGEKDPFGLRRAALGLLRILIECGLNLDLDQLLQQSAGTFPAAAQAPAVRSQVFDFMMERLRRYYLDQGVAVDTFEAVLARRPTRPLDFHRRLQAVEAFRKLPEAESLAAANKRIANILRQATGMLDAREASDTAGIKGSTTTRKKTNVVNQNLNRDALQELAEKKLAQDLDDLSAQIEPLLARSDYTGALTRLAGLRDSVDAFFDNVLVMCEDEALRNNRLALLSHLSGLFQRTADISRLQG